jgi:hypothetical protein
VIQIQIVHDLLPSLLSRGTHHGKCPALEGRTWVARVATKLSVPVAEEEVVPFEGFIDMLQNYMFSRWQVRMWCKLLTSFMFILIPLTASFSPTRHLPGFQDIFDLDNPASVRYLIAGVAFILSDIIEFWVVLKGFILSQSRNIQPKLKFFASITDNFRMKICICVMVA